MKKLLLPAVAVLAATLSWAADAPAPVVRSAGELDWHASGDLPPGAEYHLMYEDPRTHAVQTLVRMPSGYELPLHSHSADETMLVLKGRLQLTLGGATKTISSGGYAMIPAGAAFALKAKGWGGVEFMAAFSGPYDAKPAAKPAAKP
jgi:quercetin dioxygenase-like cupin family protein